MAPPSRVGGGAVGVGGAGGVVGGVGGGGGAFVDSSHFALTSPRLLSSAARRSAMVVAWNGLGGAGAFRGNRSVRLAVAGCGGPPTVGLGITWAGIIRLRVGAPVCAMGRA